MRFAETSFPTPPRPLPEVTATGWIEGLLSSASPSPLASRASVTISDRWGGGPCGAWHVGGHIEVVAHYGALSGPLAQARAQRLKAVDTLSFPYASAEERLVAVDTARRAAGMLASCYQLCIREFLGHISRGAPAVAADVHAEPAAKAAHENSQGTGATTSLDGVIHLYERALARKALLGSGAKGGALPAFLVA